MLLFNLKQRLAVFLTVPCENGDVTESLYSAFAPVWPWTGLCLRGLDASCLYRVGVLPQECGLDLDLPGVLLALLPSYTRVILHSSSDVIFSCL